MTMTCFDRNERRQWSFELCCLRFTSLSVNKVYSVGENTDKRSVVVYYAQLCLDHDYYDCVEHEKKIIYHTFSISYLLCCLQARTHREKFVGMQEPYWESRYTSFFG